MYTIGQFSRICKVTTKALRHYEKIGLITPARVDENNNYRYYTREQVSMVESIVLMKELGISLGVVKKIMGNSTGEERKVLLNEHKSVLLKQLDLCNSRLVNLSRCQKTLEAKEMIQLKKYDIGIREIQAIPVRSLRKQVEDFQENIGPMITSVLEEINSIGGACAGAPIVLYYDEDFNPGNADVEVAWPVADSSISNRILPPVMAATCMHVGPYDGLSRAYQEVFAWVNENGYRGLFPAREVYHSDPGKTPPDQLVTEIVIPLVKV